MAEKIIPQRELRNNAGGVLRAAAAGATFTVTVRGRPVARVVPFDQRVVPRAEVDRNTLRRILELPIDNELERDLAAAEAPLEGAWPA
ncbi:type II toxin-antitoxin system prevent-host-death family antitoxin [Gaiella sp.]|jgi:prevent-host-death family protein|uniref:type II toxin-antitoxin system Phd/YefM family antitoxin n=1 Tax=Gaiella sp. TaxID=2663207 RepID=UPI002E37E4AA|nr:type II toxin-antitoxin system prevent-host-death family antitoxin [Gaiella sp.]HEX5584643.1 type II toxin-antitoxin system prevent-host-death family antitoxin [Gaiella sp.]